MRVFGNLMNRIAEDVKPLAPEVGMGCTVLMFSDRHAATITKILTPKKILIQYDNATRTDTNGMSESQTYTFSPDPNGRERIVRLRKNGRWVFDGESLAQGTVVSLGRRSEYRDFSF